MGRGTSKAGAGGGGGAVLPVNTILPPPTPQQVAAGNVLPQGGTPFADFEKMSDDEKADVISKALGVGTPVFLDDSGIQRFTYFTGMSDKPTVVSDAQLDKVKGTTLYRTVNNAYNSKTDIGYTSNDILNQISKGDYTMFSDSGGSAHGKAIYFATDLADSTYYGNANQRPMTMRAKLTGGNTITTSNISSMYSNALARGDKLAVACSKADGSSARNLYALAKGYDAITSNTGSGYHMILNRRCLTVSSDYKNTKIGSNSWKNM